MWDSIFLSQNALAYRDCLSATGAADGLDDLRRKPEANIFRHDFHFFDAGIAVLLQVVDDVFNENFWSRGSGGHGDGGDAFEPLGVDGGGVDAPFVDCIGIRADKFGVGRDACGWRGGEPSMR